jgi:HEAT repeats/Cytochrome c554 and c-prime
MASKNLGWAALAMAVLGTAAALIWHRVPTSTNALAGSGPSAQQREHPSAPLPGRGEFAGAERCSECHGRNHERWQNDWHAKALSKAEPGAVLGSWSNVHYKGSSSEAWMLRRGTQYVVRTRDSAGETGEHEVAWVIGGKRMQDPLTILPDGRWQVLPVYFHVTGGGAWVDYNEAKQGPVTPDHPFFWTNFRRTANRECLDCHVTGLDVRYDRTTHAWSTTFTDAGVACESCHGPGARHAETKDPQDIVQPRKLSPERGLALCAQCHSPRKPLFPLLDAAHRFRPGERYEDRYEVLVVTNSGPERSGEFFADGRPKSSSFEYAALLQSRCYRQGGATCLSCHTAPHVEHGENELKAQAGDKTPVFDQSCRACHARLFEDVAEHSHHRSREAQSCVACHMPRVVPGVLDLFADHALDVPVPQNTTRHGVPNACNQCHAKETPAAMTVALQRLWPEAERRQARRLRLADALDERPNASTEPALAAVVADTQEAPSLRGAAALLLAFQFPQTASQALLPLLGDPSDVVRSKAAVALGLCGARSAALSLTPLLRDPALSVRQAAALTLAGFQQPEGEHALRDLAGGSDSRWLPQPHLTLALVEERRGAWDAAETELTKALELQPYNSAALISLADLQARKQRWADVQATLHEALRFDPQSVPARSRLEFLAAHATKNP